MSSDMLPPAVCRMLNPGSPPDTRLPTEAYPNTSSCVRSPFDVRVIPDRIPSRSGCLHKAVALRIHHQSDGRPTCEQSHCPSWYCWQTTPTPQSCLPKIHCLTIARGGSEQRLEDESREPSQ